MNSVPLSPKNLKIVTVIGARPQFIKCAPVSRVMRRHAREILVHTGQHYDVDMSQIFFDQLGIPEPDYNLDVGSGTHAYQTARMLQGIEDILIRECPDCVLVYGDTNSTLAGALAAAKIHVPIAHAEAGLRSFNRGMPEEINRVLTDHVSSLLFCPTQSAAHNLTREGITAGVHVVGDVMYDALSQSIETAHQVSDVMERLVVSAQNYAVVTIHRAENTNDSAVLTRIAEALEDLATSGERIIFPAHPRTVQRLEQIGKKQSLHGMLIDPLSYLDMLLLEKYAKVIVTDSGGVQKEAFWLSVPCITLRHETEWIETVNSGWNVLAGNEKERIFEAFRNQQHRPAPVVFDDCKASERLVEILCSGLRILSRAPIVPLDHAEMAAATQALRDDRDRNSRQHRA